MIKIYDKYIEFTKFRQDNFINDEFLNDDSAFLNFLNNAKMENIIEINKENEADFFEIFIILESAIEFNLTNYKIQR